MKAESKKIFLIAPLDWGLGHATRCIPIIHELLKKNGEVQIASSGSALALLKVEFPELKFHELTSYNASYSAWLPLKWKVFFQIPKFFKAVRKEHHQIEKIISQEKIDIVISDNRYGCWSSQITSVFIGHQLYLESPFFKKLLNKYHWKVINRFSVCWIPDDENENSLSGKLSKNKLSKTQHIGILSRMTWKPTEYKYDIAAILSGPEPQRTLFENRLRHELVAINKKALLVKGIPDEKVISQNRNVTEINFLNSDELNQAILESKIIICRSGYSSVMDLAKLGKKVIFVPTPGQPEQEYLADELKKKNIAYSISQNKFNLDVALRKSIQFTGFVQRKDNTRLAEIIQELIE